MNWINIKDQKPEIEKAYLITDGKIIITAFLCWISDNVDDYTWIPAGGSGYDWEWDEIDIENITHWMPLPELPK